MPTTFDSASAIAEGHDVTGRHLLHIEGYSHTKTLSNGNRIKSQPFTVGGRSWRISYFPNGMRGYSSFISICIILDDDIPEPVRTTTTFSLLDQAGEPVPAHTHTIGAKEFLGAGCRCGITGFLEKASFEASEHLVDDSFRIRCDISILKQFRKEDRRAVKSSTLAAVTTSDLHRHLGDLLVAKEGADVVFQVGDETFSAHRCVLAARSPVFKAELFGAMRESTAMEVCVRIDDMAVQVFKALLHFIYTDSLPEMTGQEDVLMAQHLLVAADRYDMQRLRLICEDKLCRCLDVDMAATTLVLSEQHRCYRLKKACIEFLKSSEALDAVMATDGFEHLTKSCPALYRELIANALGAQ